MDDALLSLNTAQRQAVLSESQVLQVLAPPGSGKTKTLTARIAHSIAAGLQPWRIIVCTFTVKAAREMQSRIRDLVPESNKIKIGTFHGVALRYLRKHKDFAGLSNAFGVADTSDSTAILRRLLKAQSNTMDAAAARSRISSLKARGIDSELYAKGEGKNASHANFLRLFRAYQAELQRAGLLDYDDILLRCVDLLRAHPECVKDIEAVYVDEFQDTNNVQYDLMALFAQRKQHITIVGDPDQSIYGWRSAEIKNLHHMRQRWPDTTTINLEENYRSSGSILMASQNVIEQDVSRPQKALQATLSYGHKPVLRRLPSARDEATWLVDEINRVRCLSGELLNHNDFAILLRTASLSRTIETALGSAGVPYRMVGGTKFYDRVEVKLVLDYLRVVDNPSHNEALARVLNVPPRRIGDKTLEALQTEAEKKNVSAWSLVQGLASGRAILSTSVSQPATRGLEHFTNLILTCRSRLLDPNATIVSIINIILQKTSLQAYLRSKYGEEHEVRWASIEDLLAQAAEPSIDQIDEDGAEAVADVSTALTNFLANTALAASVDKDNDVETAPMVTISTMHAAKGLEWPVVFVPACFNGSIPHSRSEDHDEERRLLYVAMTRAQAMLYLSCPTKDLQMQETSLSTFVSQPGCVKLFEDHGPPLGANDILALSICLKRRRPSAEAIRKSSAQLHRDLDDFWPVDGSTPLHGSLKDSMIMKAEASGLAPAVAGFSSVAGFASVRSQFDQLQQQEQKHARKEPVAQDHIIEKQDRKQAHGSITTFFTRATTSKSTMMQQHSVRSTTIGNRALTDITSFSQNSIRALGPKATSTTQHTLRSEPLYKRQKTNAADSTTVHDPYTMLHSSPTPDDAAVNAEGTSVAEKQTSLPEYKSASTTHNTSYRAAIGARRTLGIRRSMNGWAQRGQSTIGRQNNMP